MKQKTTILVAVLALLAFMIPCRVNGQTKTDELAYTLDGSITDGTNGYATESDIEQDGVTWKVTGNTTIAPWRIGGRSIENENRPLYSTSTIADNIVRIEVTHGTAQNIEVNSMTLEVSSDPEFSGATLLEGDFVAEGVTVFNRPSGASWTGMYYRIIYNVTNTTSSNRYLQFIKAEFYKDGGGLPSVATPTFDPAGGSYSDPVSVTISCATSGASIYYTTDGNTPTANSTLYSSPITISETTTVKAIGMMSGMNNSSVATATYSFTEVMTIAEARALEDNEYATVQGVVIFIDGKNVYIQDATAGIDLFLNSNAPATLELGDLVQAHGMKSVFRGLVELKSIDPSNPEHFSVISGGHNLPLAEKTIEEIFTDAAGANMLQSTRLRIVDAIVGPIDYNYNTPISQGSNSLNIYKLPEVPGLQEGDNITVIGVLGCFDSPQLRVNSADDVTISTPQDMVATPTFSPAAGTYSSTQSVTISCATEGASIHYTLDGTTPTANSALFTEPITVSTSMTIKAIGVKPGIMDSYVATAEYTITSPMTIAEARALADNEYALVQGVVTLLDGRNVYIQDATAGIDLYLNSNTVPESLALGDMVLAYGKKTVFNGLVELTGINGGNEGEFSVLSSGNTLPLVVKTIAEILADHEEGDLLQSTRVQVVDAVVGVIDNNSSTPIYQDEYTINIFKMPVVDGMIEGDIITVIAVVGCYNAAQLRVNSAEDIQFTHPSSPAVAVAPQNLSGFSYVEGNGPSAEQSFTVTGINLTSDVTLTMNGDAFEMSLADVPAFTAQSTITLTPSEGSINQTVLVRMKEGLTVDSYTGSIAVTSELDPVAVSLSGSVTGESYTWNRIYSMEALTNGCQVIIAARHDANVANSYYAMTAQVSGKPEGVLFQSEIMDDKEVLPSNIVDVASDFLWNVTVVNGVVTLTNAAGATLGYPGSGTNFTGDVSTDWTLSNETSGDGAMVPYYTGFRFTNVDVTNRSIALNSYFNFGPYATSNMNNSGYNFFLDLFVLGADGVQTVAAPVFDKPSGTYYGEIDVTITCATPDAVIYYTTNGEEPTANSTVYSAPIHVASNMIIKAVAMKEGFNNSETVSASYVISSGSDILVNQDWEDGMNGWTFVTVAGNKPWIIGNYNDNNYANANGYGDDVENEQWCISPAFNLTEYEGENVTLTFKNATKFTGPALQLLFSNDYDGQNPTSATWQALSYTPSPGNYEWTESGAIDLSSFEGSSCYIAFKYTSMPVTDGAAAWEVDDIMIRSGSSSDPAITATPTSISMSYAINQGPSPVQSYSIVAAGLLGSGYVMTLAPYHYEISLDGTNWDTELGIPYADGILVNQPVTVYVRLEAGLGVGYYNGAILHEGGGALTYVNVTGEVTDQVGLSDDLALNTKVWNYGNEIAVENATAKSLQLTVYNVLGQPVLSKNINGESSVRFAHGLANGMYIVELQNNSGRTVTKIVVR